MGGLVPSNYIVRVTFDATIIIVVTELFTHCFSKSNSFYCVSILASQAPASQY